MAGMRPAPAKSKGLAKTLTCAQRIEAATVRKTQVIMSEVMSRDAEVLFSKYDSEKTALLPRGALTELLRDIGLEKVLGDSFGASARLAFDAHSADSHFLSPMEFKQLYYRISEKQPDLLPRKTQLTISVMSAKGLPPADLNGKSDPFCTIQVVNKPWTKSQTKVMEKTLDPWWGEEFDDKYGYETIEDELRFEVFDYDKGSDSELLSTATLSGKEFDRAGGFDGRLHMLSEINPEKFTPTLKVRVVVNGLPAPPPALRLGIISARGLPPADPNGKADPFVIVMIHGKPYSKSQTKIRPKTLEPKWDEEFDDKYRYEEGDHLLFECFDYDKGGKCDLLGRATLESHQFHKTGGFQGELLLVDTLEKGYTPQLKLCILVNELEPPPEQPAATEQPAAAAESK